MPNAKEVCQVHRRTPRFCMRTFNDTLLRGFC
jgi:hypothetical protein